MQSRKNYEKTPKASTSKESDIQVSGLSVVIAQGKSNSSEKSKQNTSKNASKSQGSKASPRRKCQTRADDLKHVRPQSPSPSRGSSRASSSPTSYQEGEDYRVLQRKLSARSSRTEGQGRSKVVVRVSEEGKIYIKRAIEERSLDPDRLLIDRCHLHLCPIIEEEDQLRLLNLQQNQIPLIENLHSFPHLTFLDLSDNLIEHITGLEALTTLRMLVLARNRIQMMEGLQKLHHLDVLDLSGNEIKEICNINHLHELRILNVSSNQICYISGLRGLKSLVELNLTKNCISQVSEVDILPRLQRLFLSNNCIERFDDMYSVSMVPLLSDLTLEGCPLSALPNYRHLVLFNIPHLKVLDSRRALDEERRTAHTLMRKEEQRRQEGIRQAKVKEAKVKAIATARQLWECRCQEPEEGCSTVSSSIASAVPLHLLASRYGRSYSEEEEDMFCPCCGGQGVDCGECGRTKVISNGIAQKPKKTKSKSQKSRSQDSKSSKKLKSSASLDLEIADSKLTYLAEVDFGNLQLYGPGAVAATLSHTWSPQTVSMVHTVCFHFIVFDDITYLLAKMKALFHNIQAVCLECCCLESLCQLNALGAIPGLKTLSIDSEGNPVLQLALWRLYCVYRLSPTIEQINGSMVTELERVQAEEMFGGLGFAASLLLPKYRLSSLLNTPRVKQMFLKEKGYSPNSLRSQPDSQVATEVMKAAFTYNPDYEFFVPGCKSTAHHIVERNLSHAHQTRKKRLAFQRLWPSMFVGTVTDALEDYSDLNRHMKLSMQSLLKKCKSMD